MGVDTEWLRYFQHVADGVTVTEVADLYRVSQPGVSRALARLDHELATPLLQRSGRVLRPTYAGQVFKRHVDALLHSLDDGVAAVDELVDPETGTVTVAFQLSLGTWLIPELIARFRQRHPRVHFVLEPSEDSVGSALVAGGRIDLEITARRPRDLGVRWERLLVQPLVLAVPPGHRFARRDRVSLTEAQEEEFVTMGPRWDLRAVGDELCRSAGFTPRVAFEVNDLPVVHGFVAGGLGVALVPEPPTPHGLSAPGPERLVPLTDAGAIREVGMGWSAERRLLPSAELFRAHVIASARALRERAGH